ncbi:MAG: helix-turn-helix domain-containing protein [Pedobacter sp.]|uniref:winged helix-turn-helix transcriptional regulator n=1 Tax=Pedobacter sp. TaxID=1411316 RepID=UPI003397F629
MKTECLGDYIKLKGKTYPCTLSLTMDLIGGKWKAVILYHLTDHDKRYNELRKEMPAITEMTLSLQLKQLEQDGLVSRKVYGDKPPVKVVYGLTEFGKSLLPVLEVLTNWGNHTAERDGEFFTEYKT